MKKPKASSQSRLQFRLNPVDWVSPDVPQALKTIAIERYESEVPVLYKIVLPILKPPPYIYPFVAVFQVACTVIVHWELPIRFDGYTDAVEAVTEFLKGMDKRLKKKFFLEAEHFSWRFKAKELLITANMLYEIAEAASRERMKMWIAECKENPPTPGSNSREMTPKEVDLMYKTGVRRQAHMLLGFAIENAAKGLISHIKGVSEENKKTGVAGLTGGLKSHNLLPFVRDDCREKLTDEEANVLKELSEWVRWKGRYPIPITHHSYKFSYSMSGYTNQLYPVGKAILLRMLKRLEAISHEKASTTNSLT